MQTLDLSPVKLEKQALVIFGSNLGTILSECEETQLFIALCAIFLCVVHDQILKTKNQYRCRNFDRRNEK